MLAADEDITAVPRREVRNAVLAGAAAQHITETIALQPNGVAAVLTPDPVGTVERCEVIGARPAEQSVRVAAFGYAWIQVTADPSDGGKPGLARLSIRSVAAPAKSTRRAWSTSAPASASQRGGHGNSVSRVMSPLAA